MASANEPAVVRRVDVLDGGLANAIHAEIDALGPDFGGAILVEQDEMVTLRAGYGWANRERATPFTSRTIAQIGSLTKQFTATAIVTLANDGALDYDDTLAKHLSGVSKAAAGLTLHQLLTHTAGLPEQDGDDFDRVSCEDLITRKLNQVKRAPGSRFVYSNLGYSVLATVVEAASGQSLETYLAEKLFTPLDMRRTGTFFAAEQRDLLASGYADDTVHPPISDPIAVIAPHFWNLKGNGGMQSSVEDMYAWYRALAHGPVITEQMQRTLLAPHARYDDNVAYGYGWFVRQDHDGALLQVSHAGSDGVFYAAFVWRPADRVFFYLVTNTGQARGAPLAGRIRRAILSRQGS